MAAAWKLHAAGEHRIGQRSRLVSSFRGNKWPSPLPHLVIESSLREAFDEHQISRNRARGRHVFGDEAKSCVQEKFRNQGN